MYVCVRHFEAEDDFGYALAGYGLALRLGDTFGKEGQGCIFIVGEVEDIVYFVLGYDQHVALGERVYVEEGIVVLVLGNAVRGYLACDYA